MSDLQFAPLNAAELIITGPVALQEWREKYRQKVPGYQFTPQFKWHKWDGTWAPGKFCRETETGWELRCSRGLLRRIMTDFEIGVAFQVARLAEIESFLAGRPEFTQLRDFQVRVFHRVLAEGWGRVAFATNAGKGAVMAELAAFGAWRGDPVLIMCDELSVFDALLGELKQWGKFKINLINSGVKRAPVGGVSLAMVQTLARRIKDAGNAPWIEYLKSVRMLLLDEADKSDAASWGKILAHCKNTDWRAGFSGTFATDETNLYKSLVMDELTGPTVDNVHNMELVDRGISARPTIEIYGHDVTPALGILPAEWFDLEPAARRALAYQRCITYSETRHQFIASLVRPDTRTVIIVDKIDHGLSMTATVPGAVFLDGSAAEGERNSVLDDFTAGTTLVLVVTKILDRGSNRLGHAADIIFASSEGSSTQVLQRIGRGLRRGGGKDSIRIVDVIDRVRSQRGDKKTANAGAFFTSAGRRRLEVYAHEGFDVHIKQG